MSNQEDLLAKGTPAGQPKNPPLRSGPPPLPNSSLGHDPTTDDLDVTTIFSDGLLRFLIVSMTAVAVLLSTSILIALSKHGGSTNSIALVDTAYLGSGPVLAPPVLAEDAFEDDSVSLVGLQDRSQTNRHTSGLELANKFAVESAEEQSCQISQQVTESMPEDDPALAYYVSQDVNNDKIVQTKEPTDEQEVLMIMELGQDSETEVNAETCDADNVQPQALTQQQEDKKPKPPEQLSISAPYYGTKVEWHRKVEEAAKQAKAENKLVFLVHVSGNFTKEEFT